MPQGGIMGAKIKIRELFRGTFGAIAQNGNIISESVDLRDLYTDGNFSLHMINTGGTVTVTLLVCSTVNGTFIEPSTPVVILNAKAAGSHFEAFTAPTAGFVKFKFTETNVAPVTAMDAWLNYQ